MVITALAGCAVTPAEPPLSAVAKREEVTGQEMSYRLIDFVTRGSRHLEQAADEIAAASTDPTVRREAMLWKIYGVPAMYLATEHNDPVAILVDLWALCAQQVAYFTTGAGRDLFGAHQSVAATAARAMQTEIEAIAADLLRPDVRENLREAGAQWVADHPLSSHLFARPSIVSMVAHVFPDSPEGLFDTIQTMNAELADLKRRLGLHIDRLPRQARWEADLLANDLVNTQVDRLLTNSFQLVSQERKAVLADVERQREATLAAVRAEREIVLAETRRMADDLVPAIQGVIAHERAAALAEVDRIRRETVAELRAEPLKLELDLERSINAVGDRLLVRLVWLAGIGYIVILITIVAGYRMIRGSGSKD